MNCGYINKYCILILVPFLIGCFNNDKSKEYNYPKENHPIPKDSIIKKSNETNDNLCRFSENNKKDKIVDSSRIIYFPVGGLDFKSADCWYIMSEYAHNEVPDSTITNQLIYFIDTGFVKDISIKRIFKGDPIAVKVVALFEYKKWEKSSLFYVDPFKYGIYHRPNK